MLHRTPNKKTTDIPTFDNTRLPKRLDADRNVSHSTFAIALKRLRTGNVTLLSFDEKNERWVEVFKEDTRLMPSCDMHLDVSVWDCQTSLSRKVISCDHRSNVVGRDVLFYGPEFRVEAMETVVVMQQPTAPAVVYVQQRDWSSGTCACCDDCAGCEF
ncbi:hypothetical protein LSAT2_013745 [Lamellibrachia satsuma]|nr:hypothetical protein LSAT2_013745 [Lamellibrachia satsuma]